MMRMILVSIVEAHQEKKLRQVCENCINNGIGG